jgi:DNA-binding transcriptional LysR family regulator
MASRSDSKLPGNLPWKMRNLDLNLPLVFDAVLRERRARRYALAVSQRAVGHALNRLRHALQDKLFVRTSSGMVPTPRAEELAHAA